MLASDRRSSFDDMHHMYYKRSPLPPIWEVPANSRIPVPLPAGPKGTCARLLGPPSEYHPPPIPPIPSKPTPSPRSALADCIPFDALRRNRLPTPGSRSLTGQPSVSPQREVGEVIKVFASQQGEVCITSPLPSLLRLRFGGNCRGLFASHRPFSSLPLRPHPCRVPQARQGGRSANARGTLAHHFRRDRSYSARSRMLVTTTCGTSRRPRGPRKS